ncbi:MAG: DUF421 domain-containing protein [Methylibium sp.]|uniref:DUF421 domain-containing protein n=1 Tax=Methylibium sp. TaxID=2067992 RepID=UPI0017E1A9C9|nr:YetF domain-containing protein [Methylibium sp.]MBA3599215.1 DUF421 domain-containing protein [Methylibium sp.]
MFFDSWFGLLRVFVVGVLAYLALIVLLRVSGKRTLSKMNAFDLVVTVALGSTFATILLSKDVALAEGVLAFALLIAFQFLIAWLSVRSATVCLLVKAEPSLLLHRGQFLKQAMKAERVTEAEVRAAVRAQGVATLEEVEAVVLETDGSLNVVSKQKQEEASALKDVAGYGADAG